MVFSVFFFFRSSEFLAFFFFFLNDPPTPEISPLPLHAALPILRQPAGVDRRHGSGAGRRRRATPRAALRTPAALPRLPERPAVPAPGAAALPEALLLVSARSEEHTSELQSRLHLVCRLLLEKKK